MRPLQVHIKPEILAREDGKGGAELAKYKKLLTHDTAKNPHVSEWVLNEHFLNEEFALSPCIDLLTIT